MQVNWSWPCDRCLQHAKDGVSPVTATSAINAAPTVTRELDPGAAIRRIQVPPLCESSGFLATLAAGCAGPAEKSFPGGVQ
jgi:hypothetical protein